MSTKYRQKNDDSLLVRLPSNLKNDFKHCCDLLDVPVAEVMRVLMADFLKENNDFVLTNGGWGVKSNSAKKVLRIKANKQSKQSVTSTSDINETPDLVSIPTVEFDLGEQLTPEEDGELSPYELEWLTEFSKEAGIGIREAFKLRFGYRLENKPLPLSDTQKKNQQKRANKKLNKKRKK